MLLYTKSGLFKGDLQPLLPNDGPGFIRRLLQKFPDLERDTVRQLPLSKGVNSIREYPI